MEDKILKWIAGFLVLFTVGSTILLQHIPDLRAEIVAEQEKTHAKEEMDAFQMLRYYTNKAKVEQQEDIDFTQQLRLTLPEGVSGNDVSVTSDNLAETVEIVIPDAQEDYFYDTPVLGNSAHMKALGYDSDGKKATIEIAMESVIEIEKEYDEKYLYLDFLTPHEVYDKVIVIDAGHGGNTGGSQAGEVQEKDINLAIVLKLKALLEQEEGIGVYCTRTEDVNPTAKARIGLGTGTKADLFVSVHCNSMTNEKFSYINGTEVIYKEGQTKDGQSSKAFAQICLEEVTAALGTVNRGIMPADDVEVVNGTSAPVALIEVGFLTNEEERGKLVSEEYQQQAAQGIYNAIMRQLQEG